MHEPRSVACSPSKKPSSTPQRRSCGLLSNMTLSGSSRLTTKPESPRRAPERLVVAGLDLDDGAHRHLLGELVAPARERGAVADAAGERRRQGDDDALGAHAAVLVDDLDAVGVLADQVHGAAEAHGVAELLGQRAARSPGFPRRCGCPGRRRRWRRACRSSRRSGCRTGSAGATSGRCPRRRCAGMSVCQKSRPVSVLAFATSQHSTVCASRRGRRARPTARRAGRSRPAPRARSASSATSISASSSSPNVSSAQRRAPPSIPRR